MHTRTYTQKHETHTHIHTYICTLQQWQLVHKLCCQLLKTAKAMSVLHQPFSSNMSTSVRAHMKFAKTHIKELSLFSQTDTWDEPPRHRCMYKRHIQSFHEGCFWIYTHLSCYMHCLSPTRLVYASVSPLTLKYLNTRESFSSTFTHFSLTWSELEFLIDSGTGQWRKSI